MAAILRRGFSVSHSGTYRTAVSLGRPALGLPTFTAVRFDLDAARICNEFGHLSVLVFDEFNPPHDETLGVKLRFPLGKHERLLLSRNLSNEPPTLIGHRHL